MSTTVYLHYNSWNIRCPKGAMPQGTPLFSKGNTLFLQYKKKVYLYFLYLEVNSIIFSLMILKKDCVYTHIAQLCLTTNKPKKKNYNWTKQNNNCIKVFLFHARLKHKDSIFIYLITRSHQLVTYWHKRKLSCNSFLLEAGK